MNETSEHLDTDDLVDPARRLLGDPPPTRDVGPLGAAATRPEASAFGEDAYPDVWAKAGALLHTVVNNHPLPASGCSQPASRLYAYGDSESEVCVRLLLINCMRAVAYS